MDKIYRPQYKCAVEAFRTAFKARRENNFYFTGETHNFWELVCVTEGNVNVSENENVYELKAGDIIFHKPMEFHKIWVEGNKYGQVTIISFELTDKSFDNLGHGVFYLDMEKRRTLDDIFSLISENFSIEKDVVVFDNSNETDVKITFLQFEIFLLSILSESSKKQAKIYSTGATNYKRIIDAMNENIENNFTVDDIAKACNLSVSNLKKTFAKYGGGGVMHHYNRLRIAYAMKLLKKGLTVADISYKLGFSSQNYFSTMFKRESGMLPTEYKKNI